MQASGHPWVRRVSTARIGRPRTVLSDPLLQSPDAYMDKCAAIDADPALQFLTVGYCRPSALGFHAVNLALLLHVALVALAWGEADSAIAAAGQAALLVVGAAAALAALWTVRPLRAEDAYQYSVITLVLVTAAAQAGMNAVHTAVRLKYGMGGRGGGADLATADSAEVPASVAAGDPLVAAFHAACYVTLSAALALLVTLVAALGKALWQTAGPADPDAGGADEWDLDAASVMEFNDFSDLGPSASPQHVVSPLHASGDVHAAGSALPASSPLVARTPPTASPPIMDGAPPATGTTLLGDDSDGQPPVDPTTLVAAMFAAAASRPTSAPAMLGVVDGMPVSLPVGTTLRRPSTAPMAAPPEIDEVDCVRTATEASVALPVPPSAARHAMSPLHLDEGMRAAGLSRRSSWA
jgi:hypothetical protein